MSGNLIVEHLKKAALAYEIDTVLACAVDMPGRLVGKRFHARWAKSLVLSPEEKFAMSHTASGKPL
jgi:hypothetical protein